MANINKLTAEKVALNDRNVTHILNTSLHYCCHHIEVNYTDSFHNVLQPLPKYRQSDTGKCNIFLHGATMTKVPLYTWN